MTTLITGASSGIGAELARQLADQGRNLFITARRIDRLEELKHEIYLRNPFVTVEVAELDVTDPDQVAAVFVAADREGEGLDCVIANAGLGGFRAIGTGDARRNRSTATTNFIGTLNQAESAMEIFRMRNAGHLVVMSSFTAVRGMRGGQATYAATKRAVAHLAEGLRSELIGSPIDVTTIYPGYIRTEMTAGVKRMPFASDATPAVAQMVKGIERRRPELYAPAWPWAPLAFLLKRLPLPIIARYTASPQD